MSCQQRRPQHDAPSDKEPCSPGPSGSHLQPGLHGSHPYLLLLGQKEEDVIVDLLAVTLWDHSPDLQLPKHLLSFPAGGGGHTDREGYGTGSSGHSCGAQQRFPARVWSMQEGHGSVLASRPAHMGEANRGTTAAPTFWYAPHPGRAMHQPLRATPESPQPWAACRP